MKVGEKQSRKSHEWEGEKKMIGPSRQIAVEAFRRLFPRLEGHWT